MRRSHSALDSVNHARTIAKRSGVAAYNTSRPLRFGAASPAVVSA